VIREEDFVKLQFWGANRQVTGSRYCLEHDSVRLLIDCGMFQEREYLERNWEPSPVSPGQIDAVLLTHAHLDHCGLLPRLVRAGYRKPIFATSATVGLAELVLHDAAQIQQEDVAFKLQRHRQEGRRGRHPEVPLYSFADVDHTVRCLRPVPYGEPVRLGQQLTAVFHDAGHILGSAMVELAWQEGGRARRAVFSGDVGAWGRPIIRDPSLFTQADFVVMESTYGDRLHDGGGDIQGQLAEVLGRTLRRGGNVVIPVFAIERAQELTYTISQLVHEGALPQIEVFLDSPMAAGATRIFTRHRECFNEEIKRLLDAGQDPLQFPGLRIIRTAEDSKALNHRKPPAVIMASSGMCTAGRIKHHLRHNVSRPESTILFVGYQSQGTLGRQILDGGGEVRIHGRMWPVRAEIAQIHGFSGHSDRDGLMRWLSSFQTPPERLFLTHGEAQASSALAERIRAEKAWQVTIPSYQETFSL
jgi:metallo-beta-lactamase family protein